MNSEELKRACEMAGMKLHPHPIFKDEWCVYVEVHRIGFNHPMLPAYVAELLAQRDEIVEHIVSEMNTTRPPVEPHKYECEVLTSELEKHKGNGDTPAEAIIRAAMSVLEGQ